MVLSINIPYWHTDDNRLRNVSFAIKCANLLIAYLVANGIRCELNIFDFSIERVLEGCVHLPIEGEFNKSKKINTAIKWLKDNKKNSDYTCFWDADCFIDPNDFPLFKETLLDDNVYWCNNMNKLRSSLYGDPKTCSVTPFAVFYSSGIIRGLGAIWVCNTEKLELVGGFNENYTNWGKEDEEMGDRLEAIGCSFRRTPFAIWHLPHPVSKTKLITA